MGKTVKTDKNITSVTTEEDAAALAARAAVIYVLHKNLLPSPFRLFSMFPIMQDKVASLSESMVKTGQWPSIIARPKDNMIDGKVIGQEELMTLIASGADLSHVVWEQAFGHHRKEASLNVGYTDIPIIPQIVDDERMLLMMANENKEGYGSSIFSLIETVRQVKESLEKSIEHFDDYDDYKASFADGTTPFFESAKSFKAAQDNGVGYRTIRKFLGETWSDRDVRSPMVVLKAVEDGVIEFEKLVGIPSLTMMELICAIARSMKEGYTPQTKDAVPVPAPAWPDYFKEAAIDSICERCKLDPAGGKNDLTVTTAMLESAKAAMQKDGVNPASYLRAGKGKTAFDVLEATKELFLVPDKDLASNLAAIEDLSTAYGFEGWDGLADLQEKLRAVAKKMEEKRTAGPEAPVEGDGSVAGPDVDAAIHEGEIKVEGATQVAPEDTAAFDGQAASMAEVLGMMATQVVVFHGQAEIANLDDETKAQIAALLDASAKLAFAVFGKKVLTDTFNSCLGK